MEKGFAVFAILFLPASEIVWPGIILAVFAVTFFMLVPSWRAVRALLAVTWPTLLPLLLAACSLVWSVDPALTLYQTIALVGTTAFGIFLALRFSPKEQLELLALVLALVACASAAVALLFPSYGVMTDHHTRAWSGIFFHKNSLGRMMALATLVFSLLALDSRELRPPALLGLALSIALLFASSSKASLIVGILCLAAVGILATAQLFAGRNRIAILVLAAIVIVFTAMLAIQHEESVLSALTRDPSFTGRTELWGVLLEKARVRPWLGYGYGAFWRGAIGVSGDVQEKLHGWYPIHAHNGFLDLVLELGIAGFLIVIVPLGMFAYRVFTWAVVQRSPFSLWPFGYLFFFVLSNLAESAFVRQNTIYWALYIAAIHGFHLSSANRRSKI